MARGPGKPLLCRSPLHLWHRFSVQLLASSSVYAVSIRQAALAVRVGAVVQLHNVCLMQVHARATVLQVDVDFKHLVHCARVSALSQINVRQGRISAKPSIKARDGILVRQRPRPHGH